MPELIPFEPGRPKYDLHTTIDGVPYTLEVRWNDREDCEGWYFNLLEEDATHIADGLRIVLGTYIGRHVDHRLFKNGVLIATDTEHTKREATLNDITRRVQVRYYTLAEILGNDPDATIVVE
jgi:trans-2-enoyl-CoA reductase